MAPSIKYFNINSKGNELHIIMHKDGLVSIRPEFGWVAVNYFHNHLTENLSCSYSIKDPTHFSLHCPRYAAIRTEVVNTCICCTDFKSIHCCFTVLKKNVIKNTPHT